MSQTTKRRKHARKMHKRPRAAVPDAPRPTRDRTIYAGLVLIGFFTVAIGWVLFPDSGWLSAGITAVLYVATMAYLVNIHAWHVYRGRHLGNLSQSLARIPLRFVGYGTRTGKPLEAAHGHAEVRTALTMSLLVSLAIVVVLAMLLIPPIRPW
jgi:hypothetical protein